MADFRLFSWWSPLLTMALFKAGFLWMFAVSVSRVFFVPLVAPLAVRQISTNRHGHGCLDASKVSAHAADHLTLTMIPQAGWPEVQGAAGGGGVGMGEGMGSNGAAGGGSDGVGSGVAGVATLVVCITLLLPMSPFRLQLTSLFWVCTLHLVSFLSVCMFVLTPSCMVPLLFGCSDSSWLVGCIVVLVMCCGMLLRLHCDHRLCAVTAANCTFTVAVLIAMSICSRRLHTSVTAAACILCFAAASCLHLCPFIVVVSYTFGWVFLGAIDVYICIANVWPVVLHGCSAMSFGLFFSLCCSVLAAQKKARTGCSIVGLSARRMLFQCVCIFLPSRVRCEHF